MINLKRKILLHALILFIIVGFFPSASLAEADLTISRWIVEANLLKNGDLEISEDLTFNFNDEFNGIFRNIIMDKIDSIENLSVYELVKGDQVPYKMVDKAKKGESEKFTSKREDKNLVVQVFSPSSNEKKTFRFSYLLKNVAVRQVDTGDLYYKFIGSDNETPIDYFSSNLNLPKFEKEKIKIFAHGPEQGKIYFSDEKIKSEIKDIDPNQFIENRILFPKEYILTNKSKGEKTFVSIVEEEEVFAKKVEDDIEKKADRKEFLSKLSLYLSAFAMLIFAFLFYKFRRDTSVFEQMESTYPDDITPAELALFISQSLSPRALLASLLDLSHKGYIDITETDGKGDSKEYVFERTQKTADSLKDHEVFLLDWIFNRISATGTVSTLDLENYRNISATKFYGSQTEWTKLIKSDLYAKNYYDKSSKKWGIGVMILSIVWFALAIVTFTTESIYGMMPLFVGIGLFITALVLIYRTTDKGYIQFKLWKGFKKSMLENSEKNVDIENDRALIYAIALDVPMKGLNKFRTSIDEDYYPLQWGYLFFLTNPKGGSQFEDKFTNRFYGYAGSSSSTNSSIGGGGGFTGGGGGGAGGGGAGGF